jgi:hypothetical protein
MDLWLRIRTLAHGFFNAAVPEIFAHKKRSTSSRIAIGRIPPDTKSVQLSDYRADDNWTVVG